MKLRKLMFVLPNLFTLTSIFCGFYAITLCAGEASPSQLYQAALAIFFAIFFDGFDGRVARLTRTQSQFGVELDSLADVISFGVAPAMLVYKWALMALGFIGLFISFAFAACGALRLARFNVLAQRSAGRGASRFFVGLPTPLAAGMIVSLVIAHYGAKGGPLGGKAHIPIAVVVSVLAVLMVSTVRYRTFKDVRLSPKSASVFMLICLGGVLVGTQFHPAYVLAAYFATYLALGLIESGVLLRNHLVARKMAASTPASPGAVLSDDEDEDEEADVDEEDFL
ncbi:MAG TPA: CDP-diacylglycerol--serine O-phosphatidyltransferase [Myxococcaceae bacterium]|nr:CDP-diacylglycerol--serine O-phosphatidyltransferase [Myxococcaceae bacterium]